ncbi:phage shock protein operon transcriptional activator [Candidatus Sumerlaeota bacterium]|nr:phage shock protein operon transcriptional activator [Candidatus Sumerlaeota bacterium]
MALPTHTEALGQSEVFLEFQEKLSRVAKIDRPVLLIGERGTGKELAAARIHYLSGRWQAPLIPLNAATLPGTLIESELFGYEAGAFTGAARRRIGRFEQADEGTLFLDEIGLIPIVTQEKILRVVEYGAFERVGSSKAIQADVRIVGATNQNLAGLADAGAFKRDLLDRLSFEVIFLPPLRERGEDILLLASHFAARMTHELGWPAAPEFSPQAIDLLEHYSWPGNIRELKNVVERAVYRSDAPVIENIDFNPFQSPYSPLASQTSKEIPIKQQADLPNLRENDDQGIAPYHDTIRRTEIGLLRSALTQTQFNQKKAAQLLQLSYHQFRWLYRKHEKELANKTG